MDPSGDFIELITIGVIKPKYINLGYLIVRDNTWMWLALLKYFLKLNTQLSIYVFYLIMFTSFENIFLIWFFK